MVNAEFVCCCIPLINVGIYFVLLEHLVAGIAAGVLAVASPTIVGSSVPNFSIWIFAILCFIVAGVQILGFVGVVQEKKGLFKVYASVNMAAVLATFSIAAALVLVSGLKRATAIADCQSTFYAPSTTNSSTSIAPLADSANKICTIFTIVDVSVMGGLWVLLFIVQAYFLAVTFKYKKEQAEDHSRYNSMYSQKGGYPGMDAEDIPLSSSNPQGDVWNTRPSNDSLRSPTGYQPPVGSTNMAGGPYNNPSNQTETSGYAPQTYGDEQNRGGGYNDHPNAYGVRESYEGPRDPYTPGGGGDGGFVPPAGHEGYGREDGRGGGGGGNAWEQEQQQGRPTWEQEQAYGRR
ncbi:hypothetical protein BDY24DRAFT_346236 [Mrakia frigida]|uniref:DUF308 domain-containing protein n=1 Tax=Mrakia frigida TaxID=29902 RepID=UPI003FCC23FE